MYAGFLTNQFSKIGGMKSENLGYFRTQFYQKVTRTSDDLQSTTQVTVQKHRYQKVSIPRTHSRAPKFLQKGIIFIWPQKKRLHRKQQLTLFTWVLSHMLYWFYTMNLLPSGSVLPLQGPPWKYEPPIRKPENRDYIIEPDWDSRNY
ncbi:unnamed protein product [Phaedon cochleariae]|uniref:Uncharacterized protein n=1 Tax=Phaedon cochleariae TaxID=80249 RepID=A0A9N9SHR1_PHACE|nr:unnamed protein product [Phaedon cochleariae]